MREKSLSSLHRIISALVAISIIISGICLAAGCLFIYFSDSVEYSRIAVADVFAAICIPVYICLALTVSGCLCDIFLPYSKKGGRTRIDQGLILESILKKRSADSLSDAFLAKHYREKGKRTLNSIIMAVLTAVSCIVFFVYSLDPDNFSSTDINGSVISAMWVLIPCVLIPFSFYVYLIYDRERGFKGLVSDLRSDKGNESAPGTEHSIRFEGFDLFFCRIGSAVDRSLCGNRLIVWQCVLISLGLLCLVFGLLTGGTNDVFTKASNICTECIGLG